MVATLKMKNENYFSNEHSKDILHSSFFILYSSFFILTTVPEGSAFGLFFIFVSNFIRFVSFVHLRQYFCLKNL